MIDSYLLLKWILAKFGQHLPYSNLNQLSLYLNYETAPRWARDGVPTKVMIIVEKDLIIAKLMNKIEEDARISITELKDDYRNELSLKY